MQILAGQYKGRKLLGPKTQKITRPITSSVKKSLFGMLGEAVCDAVVVDLFCGTGTLGLEALSRGARTCYFAERDRTALQRLQRNIETVQAKNICTVWRGDIFNSLTGRLKRLTEPIDIAFVDPPYAQSRKWSWQHVEQRIFAPLVDHLAEDGTVILRVDSSVKLPENLALLTVSRLRKYGDMVLALLSRQ